MRRKLIIDCDTGSDDAVAIMLAALHPQLDLVGVTTVNGNVPVENCTDNSLRVLDFIGRGDIPVYEGLNRPIARADFPIPRAIKKSTGIHSKELPIPPARSRKRDMAAVEFLIETYRAATEEIALVPVGPVTVLRRSWVDYVSKRVLSQSAVVERLDLSHADGRTRSFRIEDGRWRLVGAEGARPEVGEFAQDELRDLVGSKVIDARGARFDAPEWTVRLMRGNGDELGALRVFEDAADRPLAVQAGARAPVAFELSTRQSRELRALWQ